MHSPTLTPERANALYDLLVRLAGAPENHRVRFVCHFEGANPTDEWRFCGALGLGGKLTYDRDGYRVTCYQEDLTPERQQMIERANEALGTFNSGRR